MDLSRLLVEIAAEIAPRRGEGRVAVWSPGLNAAGTSTVGAMALEKLVEKTGWAAFG